MKTLNQKFRVSFFRPGGLGARSFSQPMIMRAAILIGAAIMFGISMFASFDHTHAQRESSLRLSNQAMKQDGANSPILPAAGCMGANFTQPAGSPLAVGIMPRAVVSADFNGDGKPDLAVVSDGSDDVTILLGNGTGGFTKAAGSPIVLGFSSTDLAVGDFNLDGKPDLIASNSVGATVDIFLGDGAGGFGVSTLNVTGGAGVKGLAVADYNLDGKPDFAVANFKSGSVAVMFGNGSGGFSAAPFSPVPVGANPVDVTTGDFNQDGKPDLAVSDFGSDDVTILLNTGSGTFTPAAQSPVAVPAHPARVVTADLNNDGKLDLVTANVASASVSVLLGNGNGTFHQAPGSPLTVASPTWSVSVADFNLDGKPDLVVSDTGGNNAVQIFLGDGLGGFSQASGSPVVRTTHVMAGTPEESGPP